MRDDGPRTDGLPRGFLVQGSRPNLKVTACGKIGSDAGLQSSVPDEPAKSDLPIDFAAFRGGRHCKALNFVVTWCPAYFDGL